jgi:hypothetical protein
LLSDYHPSRYDRVRRSLVWFKENQDNPTANAVMPTVAR